MSRLDRLARSARQVAAGLASVPSPCVSVCRMRPDNGLCEGCFRTLDEIAQWSYQDETGKRNVWAQLALRIDHSRVCQP